MAWAGWLAAARTAMAVFAVPLMKDWKWRRQ
jgi:hypothetical protein